MWLGPYVVKVFFCFFPGAGRRDKHFHFGGQRVQTTNSAANGIGLSKAGGWSIAAAVDGAGNDATRCRQAAFALLTWMKNARTLPKVAWCLRFNDCFLRRLLPSHTSEGCDVSDLDLLIFTLRSVAACCNSRSSPRLSWRMQPTRLVQTFSCVAPLF